jgi:hypothetical protein
VIPAFAGSCGIRGRSREVRAPAALVPEDGARLAEQAYAPDQHARAVWLPSFMVFDFGSIVTTRGDLLSKQELRFQPALSIFVATDGVVAR